MSTALEHLRYAHGQLLRAFQPKTSRSYARSIIQTAAARYCSGGTVTELQ